ncbi:MAG TPA: DoxX family membrane protein [bacterium]|nr:DoxX family membrane protein [bacterium]
MSETRFSSLQMTALVILRALIGWHFLYEGVAKLTRGNWSAAGFLLESKWIFAPVFKWMAQNESILRVVDAMNIWGLILIGLALILGCLTRTAASAGMLLLTLYYLSTPPLVGLYYAIPSEGHYLIVNKNLVEIGALFVIAVTRSGQFAGIDRILGRLTGRSRR